MNYMRNLGAMDQGRSRQAIARSSARLGLGCAGLCVATVLAGCAGTPTWPERPPVHEGAASWHAVEPPGTVHYQLALGEVSSGGTALVRVTPTYPAGELAACPPVVEVIAKLIVDTRGRVAEVRPEIVQAALADRSPFLEATRAAAMQWRFDPLQINRWSADANGESHVVDSRTEPFSLDYVFRFSCHAGRAGVSTGAPVAAR